MITAPSKVTPYLDQIRRLEFVKDLHYTTPGPGELAGDGALTIRTPKGTFAFLVERKNSYLDRALLNGLIAQAKYHTQKHRQALLLFSRYVPRPSAERLIQSRINFVDQAGIMHLVLGRNYERTIVGNKESASEKEEQSLTAAKVQLLFTLAAHDEARNWTVRQLAEASGLGKSNVAKVRQQFVQQDILRHSRDLYELRRGPELEERMVRGYEQVMRPKLFLNRFRSAEPSPEKALEKIRPTLAELSIRWSLTGGLAAHALQRFYKGTELVLFLDSFTGETVRRLRLLPDASGPITLLRGFGTIAYWKELQGTTIAHPWLIYSELMRSSDPRAHEAATELKGEFLNRG